MHVLEGFETAKSQHFKKPWSKQLKKAQNLL